MINSLEVEIAGRKLQCSHCETNVSFHQTESVQSGPGGFLMPRFRRTSVYTCSRCGLRHAFSSGVMQPGTTVRDEADERIECLSCGAEMPSDADSCPQCGWSWDTASPDQTTA